MFSEIERHSKVGGATLSEHLARGATFVHLLVSAPDFFPECRVEQASRWASLAFSVRSAASEEGERALLSVAAPSHPIIVVAPVSLLSFFFFPSSVCSGRKEPWWLHTRMVCPFPLMGLSPVSCIFPVDRCAVAPVDKAVPPQGEAARCFAAGPPASSPLEGSVSSACSCPEKSGGAVFGTTLTPIA